MESISRLEWLKRAWPRLVARWAVFALIVGGIGFAAGESLMASALLGLVLGGLLNIAWCWVA
jgi:hypothetical protein